MEQGQKRQELSLFMADTIIIPAAP